MKNEIRINLLIGCLLVIGNFGYGMGNKVAKPTEEIKPQQNEAVQENTGTDEVVQEEYVPEVIIEGKWGSGPGEFGLAGGYFDKGQLVPKNPNEIPDYPKSMAVNSKGDIYILDQVNRHIQKFSAAGKFLMEIPTGDKGYGVNIVIDSEDNLYYYLIYSKEKTGEVWLIKDDIVKNKWGVPIIETLHGLVIDGDDNVWLNRYSPERYNVLNQKYEKIKKEQVFAKNGLIINIDKNKKEGKALLEFKQNNKPYREVNLKEKYNYGKDFWISLTVPVNSKGEFFIHHGEYKREKRIAYLDKYTPGGDLISTAMIPGEAEHWIETVDNAGNIYQLLGKDEGMQVIKWKSNLAK